MLRVVTEGTSNQASEAELTTEFLKTRYSGPFVPTLEANWRAADEAIRAKAEETPALPASSIDRTYRLGPGVSWQLTKHMGLSANLSNTIAGDVAHTSHSRNTEFDCAWTYRFARGKEGLKKVAGQFFVRYANHYSHSLERVFVSDSLRKNQTLTANLGITFF